MRCLIKNAKIVTQKQVIDNGYCAFSNGVIDYVGKEIVDADKTIDWEGNYLVPGFIDLHCHGGNGYEFIDATKEQIKEICDLHLSKGTTTLLCPTYRTS